MLPGRLSAFDEMFRALPYLLLTLVLVASAVQLLVFFPFTPDDSFVSMRYARHLADGEGLVYNSGERVEGFSNPLIVLLAAIAYAAGADPLRVVKWIGILCFAMIAALLWWHGRRAPWGIALSMAMVLPAFGLTFFAVSGLETVPAALSLLGLVLASCQRRWFVAALLLCTLSVLRPEGPAYILVPIFAAWLALRSSNARAGAKIDARGTRRLVVAGLFFLGALVCGFVARLAYFGSFVPNTFLAKAPWVPQTSLPWWTFPLRGLDDLATFAMQVQLPVLVVLVALSWASLKQSPSAILAIVGIAVAALFQKWAGGDWMVGARFMAPAIPLAGVLWIESVSALPGYLLGKSRGRAIAAGLCLAFISLAAKGNDTLAFIAQKDQYPESQMAGTGLIEAGNWLRMHVPSDWTLWNPCIGAIGWASGLRTIDPQGLVSRDVSRAISSVTTPEARDAAIADLFREVRPEIVVQMERTNQERQEVHGQAYQVVWSGWNGDSPIQFLVREDLTPAMAADAAE